MAVACGKCLEEIVRKNSPYLKTAVIVSHPEGGEITDGLYVPLERPNVVLVHPVSQELHGGGGGGEHALRWVDLQAVLL